MKWAHHPGERRGISDSPVGPNSRKTCNFSDWHEQWWRQTCQLALSCFLDSMTWVPLPCFKGQNRSQQENKLTGRCQTKPLNTWNWEARNQIQILTRKHEVNHIWMLTFHLWHLSVGQQRVTGLCKCYWRGDLEFYFTTTSPFSKAFTIPRLPWVKDQGLPFTDSSPHKDI